MINPPRGKQENALSDYWWINEHELREVEGVVCCSVLEYMCVWALGDAELKRSRQQREGRVMISGEKVRWDRWKLDKRIEGVSERRCVRRRKGGQIRFKNRRFQSEGQQEPTIWVLRSPGWAPPDCWTCWLYAEPGPLPPTPRDE